MFESYLKQKAFAPLVQHFRGWNWEWSYNDDLLRLISVLETEEDWSSLRNLWSAVVAKRRANYNRTLEARQSHPDKILQETVEKTRDLLLESLDRFDTFAGKFGKRADLESYHQMRHRVRENKRA